MLILVGGYSAIYLSGPDFGCALVKSVCRPHGFCPASRSFDRRPDWGQLNSVGTIEPPGHLGVVWGGEGAGEIRMNP